MSQVESQEEIKSVLYMYLLIKLQFDIKFAEYCTLHNNNRDEMKLLQSEMIVIFALVSGEIMFTFQMPKILPPYSLRLYNLLIHARILVYLHNFRHKCKLHMCWSCVCES